MEAVLSTIGTPAYGISKCLVGLIQPTLNKKTHGLKISTTFLDEAKQWKISISEI